MALPLAIQKRIDRYEPVDFQGLTLHPIKVRDIEEFSQARGAIEFVQQSLPTRFWGIPLLSAFFKIDLDAALKGQTPSGLFAKAIMFLVLALRLGEGQPMDERIKLMQPVVDPNDPTVLQSIRFRVNGEEQ